jgi:hypothetical protein
MECVFDDHEGPNSPARLNGLVGQLSPEAKNHGTHLILYPQFPLLEIGFFDQLLLGQMVMIMEIMKFLFETVVLLGQAMELRARGHQLVLDLVVVHRNASSFD